MKKDLKGCIDYKTKNNALIISIYDKNGHKIKEGDFLYLEEPYISNYDDVYKELCFTDLPIYHIVEVLHSESGIEVLPLAHPEYQLDNNPSILHECCGNYPISWFDLDRVFVIDDIDEYPVIIKYIDYFNW